MPARVTEVQVPVIIANIQIQAIVAILQPLDVQNQRSLTDRLSCEGMLGIEIRCDR
jgi:hypothetical protein